MQCDFLSVGREWMHRKKNGGGSFPTPSPWRPFFLSLSWTREEVRLQTNEEKITTDFSPFFWFELPFFVPPHSLHYLLWALDSWPRIVTCSFCLQFSALIQFVIVIQSVKEHENLLLSPWKQKEMCFSPTFLCLCTRSKLGIKMSGWEIRRRESPPFSRGIRSLRVTRDFFRNWSKPHLDKAGLISQNLCSCLLKIYLLFPRQCTLESWPDGLISVMEKKAARVPFCYTLTMLSTEFWSPEKPWKGEWECVFRMLFCQQINVGDPAE